MSTDAAAPVGAERRLAVPHSDGYDPAEEFAQIAYQSGVFDTLYEQEEEQVNANRYLQDAIIAAGNRPEIAGFWRNQGWEDSNEMLIPAEDDGGEVVDLGDDDGEFEFTEEWE